jgi:DNA-binding NtrC family response regulator
MENELLIIDDDLGYITIVQKHLMKEGFSVHIAESFEKINNYLKLNLPDIILIDVLMNNGKGLEILKKLNQENQKAPLIVISKGKDIHTIEKAFKYGAYDYLIKPFNLKDLHNKVAYAIDNNISKKTHHV